MAKLRNTFLKSKMNKDLDSRLVPTGEYRDALNITVGKSEAASVGTAQNVLGNSEIGTGGFVGGVLNAIGYIKDDSRNIVILFQTTYEDPSETQITPAPSTATCRIVLVDFNGTAPVQSTLVEGNWLNLAYNNQYSITGVNLVEDLLFWTDNRNQPRKINIATALADSTYYKYEHQISVAKYAPIEPIQLFKKVETRTTAGSTGTLITVASTTGIEVGMFLVSNSTLGSISGGEYIQVVDVNSATTLTVDNGNASFSGVTVVNNQDLIFLSSTMTDQSSDATWPGDPDYLEGRYVRFSYRLRYDDNEYSTFAPFTQICFIPKQKGYLINGDEQSAFRSTILDFFENNVNNIELLLPLPTLGSKLISDYSISEVDILYKESESLVVSVLETIEVSELQTSIPNTNIFNYTYRSEKPYKTLPEAQTTRVYDKVPVRARAQEVSGNRVIYGNYRDAWTTPESINYNISAQAKTSQFTNFIEYPNHTLKQNRNYQVGFILADKYNRQTSVILSSNDTGSTSGSTFFGGSTIYSAYTTSTLVVKTWFGNALRVLVNSPISVLNDTIAGTPGLYANAISTGLGFAITDTVVITPTTYTFNLNGSFPSQNQVPTIGSYLRGQFTDYVEVKNITGSGSGPYVVTTDEQVNDIYRYDQINPPTVANTKFAYTINSTGWYSYKVVVKQQEQQYYNSYLPGMLNAYPDAQTSDSNVKYIQAAFGTANANTTGAKIISVTETPPMTDLIAGMSVVNRTTAFTNPSAVLVDSISGIGTGTISVTVNQNVNVTNGDSLSFLGSEELIEHGVNTTSFPVDEQDKTAHIVLINDNINKIPRDLTEVGPDQKQYRSSVELFGRVENFGDTLTLNAGTMTPLAVSVETNTFNYITTTADGLALTKFKPGDAVQAEDGGPASGDVYPAEWLKDTVIVSNTVVGTTGTIVFAPKQIIYGTGSGNPNTIFSFLREENKQYFPERKADTVNTISTARDLDFLPNSIDNVRGTAALNFYQLDTNPLIARISTVKGIGATAQNMLPFLSVYETKPTESQLDIFWETASTGYISDLNADVLTGFDGPVGFTPTNYTHVENQDGTGANTTEGNPLSKFITTQFFAIDLSGSNMTGATMVLANVEDLTGTDRTSDFALISGGSPGGYRLTINPTSSFVFNRDANTKENYVFTIDITYTVASVTYTDSLTTTGRLQNASPVIINGCSHYDTTIDQTATTVVTIDAKNGAHLPTNSDSDLFYEIVSGNSGGYFTINPVNGTISVDPTPGTIPIGFYSLDIKVTDAYDGDALINTGQPQFSSKSVQCSTANVGITVGQEQVPVGYRTDTTNVITGVANFLGDNTSPSPNNFNRTEDPTNTTALSITDPAGNEFVVKTGGIGSTAETTVSTKVTRPTFKGTQTTADNVKFACLYLGPESINIDTDFNDLTSTTYGSNLGTAALPVLNEIVDGFTLSAVNTAGPYMGGASIPQVNGAISPVGLLSGQLEISNKVKAEGSWIGATPNNWDRGSTPFTGNGQINLYYKIFYRPATIAEDGTVTYTANTPSTWNQVGDMNGSVSSTGWTNAAGGDNTNNANNPLRTKVYMAPRANNLNDVTCSGSGTCLARTASRQDTFILDGTKNPGEYCIVYKLEVSGATVATGTPSTGFSDQPYYPTGNAILGDGTIEISTKDYNFTAGGALRFAPGAGTVAQYVVNPSIASPPGPYSVGYVTQSQDPASAPVANNTYNTNGTFNSGVFDIILDAAQVTANPVSPYLNITGTGIPGSTYIAAINVGGDPNKIKLSAALTGTITPSDNLTIGRPTLTAPFDGATTGIKVYSTQGSSNGINQLFTDVDCTNKYQISGTDGSSDLFKLYNQFDNAANPAFIDYQPTIAPGYQTNNSNGMPPLTNKPLASAKIDGDGYITSSGTTSGDRGNSPMSQSTTP